MLLLSLLAPALAAGTPAATGSSAAPATTITTVTVVPATGTATTTTTTTTAATSASGGAADTKAAETKAAETKAAETKAAETKAAETKAADTKAADTKAADTKAADTKATTTPPAGDVLLVLQPGGAMFADRQLPAGKEVTVSLVDPLAIGGTLRLWRSVGGGCDAPDETAAGYQEVGFVPVSGGMTARVAPLASGVPLCLSAEVRRKAPAGLWEAYRVQIAEELRETLKGGAGLTPCTAGSVQALLASGAAAVSLPAGVAVEPTALEARLQGALGATTKACLAYNLAATQLIGVSGAPTLLAGGPLATAVADPTWLPPVRVGATFVPFGRALATGKPEELKAASAALLPLAEAGVTQADDWRARLDAAAAKKKAPSGSPPGTTPVLLGVDGAYVPWADFVRDLGRVAPDTLASQIAAGISAAATAPRPDPFAATQEGKAFAGALTAHAGREALEAEVAAAEDALYAAVYDALDPAVSPIATESVRLTTTGATALPLKAEKDGVYFSTAFGAGTAVAFGGTAPEAWAVPYVGVDVYLAPIDRAVGVRDLDGLPFRRVGLTVALAVYSPVQEVPNRLEEGLLANVSFLGGVTYRIGRFTNLTAFVVPYKVSPDNPLAEPYRLSAATGLALSFDADVWSGVKTAIEKL